MEMNLPALNRFLLGGALNGTLADLTALMLAAKQAHWNVKGPQFQALHGLFDDLAGEVRNHADDVAERAVQLGVLATGTLEQAATSTRLPPYPPDLRDGLSHVQALAERVAMVSNLARQGIIQAIELGDQDTADLYIEVSRSLDKRLWMLRAHLEVTGVPLVRLASEEDVAGYAQNFLKHLAEGERHAKNLAQWGREIHLTLASLEKHKAKSVDAKTAYLLDDLDEHASTLSRDSLETKRRFDVAGMTAATLERYRDEWKEIVRKYIEGSS